mmetsp:Transcript_9439/g.36844  ORF Transcript_9439/g.36844 Transcript_9439/m.36844 type:complete len:203 (-) Transcript_9439:1426-2034(-)
MVIDPWRSCRLPRDSRAHRKQMGPDCPGGAPHQFGRSKQAACEAGPSRQSALQPTQRRLASAEGRAATTRTGTAFQAKRGRVGAAADELVAGGRGRRTPPGEEGGAGWKRDHSSMSVATVFLSLATWCLRVSFSSLTAASSATTSSSALSGMVPSAAAAAGPTAAASLAARSCTSSVLASPSAFLALASAASLAATARSSAA